MKAEHAKGKKALVVAYNYLLNDPPARQAAESLAKAGYETAVFQSPPQGVFATPAPQGVRVVAYPDPGPGGGLRSLLRWWRFEGSLRREIRSFQPDVVVTFMLYSLAALPVGNRKFKHVACIYDIPNIEQRGSRLNQWIIKTGWKNLKQADLVWGSDPLKADWAKRLGGLPETPVACHNCPPENYMKEPLWPRDPWLRKELIRLGASLKHSGGSILVRAGAVGEDCGLEETLEAMTHLPQDYVFLMLGRPGASYLQKLKERIHKMGLEKRAFVWDKASDETWQKALRGADLGQMIHMLPSSGEEAREAYRLNSGLSYNRTFLYMAAGLTVLSFDDPRLEPLYKETGSFQSARLAHLASDIGKIWLKLGKSKALRRKMGASGRKAHLKKYSWEKQFDPLLQTIKSWN